ncbi:MSMEG_0565 family glycosyltransferase [Ancylobacter oerskovii]|uniref:MSMEG_0565 family glycosyltransferase n=1 Tax=Ancylobacter oerskovii TaxID=459519 RepID=A0ABW4Z031_9HYPH|nr:MSMEG_0565 family glycosyltransferase [Ancylobacter oerskovii]MBS7541527.1 MSMEG_0565 family glycosyltransferase [Ancylobacter oerskovii]
MARSLRIAMLTHSTNPRGGVVHAMSLCEALAALGHRPVLFAPDAGGAGFFRAPACEAVAFKAGPAPAGMTAMVEQRIADYVAHFESEGTEGFDLFHAHDGISGNALATLKQRGAIPGFLRTVHHIDTFTDPRLAALQERAIRAADGWFAVSHLWQTHLAETYGLAAALSGNGVDLARFRPQPDGGEGALRVRLGLGDGPVLLAVGGIEARKNTLRILEAFLQLRALHPKAELVIAGGASLLDHGAYQEEFAARLAQAGGHGIHVTGPLADADMPRLYRLADALVFASVKEGFGLCVLEAMASGLPVVVSRIAPFTGYLADDEAIWCDPQRPAAIADAMALALRPGARGAFVPRGFDVAARHDWARVAQAHLPLYIRFAEIARRSLHA